MQTGGKMQTEDCRPGVKCRPSSKTTRFPEKTSRVSRALGRVSREKLATIVMASGVSNSISSDGFGVDILF